MCVCITGMCGCALDGIEGHYSREVSISYRDFEHIVVSPCVCMYVCSDWSA